MCSLQRQGLPRSNSGTHNGSEVGTSKGSCQLFPSPHSGRQGQKTACRHSHAGRGRGMCLGAVGDSLISCSGWVVRSWLWWPKAGSDFCSVDTAGNYSLL